MIDGAVTSFTDPTIVSTKSLRGALVHHSLLLQIVEGFIVVFGWTLSHVLRLRSHSILLLVPLEFGRLTITIINTHIASLRLMYDSSDVVSVFLDRRSIRHLN